MIDLHCHILPGIDDGAKDLDDAVAMARQAEADGIEVVCATPHIRHDHDVLIEELPARVADLNAELAKQAIGVEIGLGGEVAETAVHGLSPEELRGVSLGGGGRWLLVEPAPGPLGDSLSSTIDDLKALGYGSIVAHPERHPGPSLVECIRALVTQGALIQVTSAELATGPAAIFMFDLARQGLVHLLGSDSHSARIGRPVKLSDGLERLAAVELTRPHVDWMARTGPRAIIRGEEIEPPFRPTPA